MVSLTHNSLSVIGASIGQLRTMKYITEDEAKEEVTVMFKYLQLFTEHITLKLNLFAAETHCTIACC
jgi:hypothetical protein